MRSPGLTVGYGGRQFPCSLFPLINIFAYPPVDYVFFFLVVRLRLCVHRRKVKVGRLVVEGCGQEVCVKPKYTL